MDLCHASACTSKEKRLARCDVLARLTSFPISVIFPICTNMRPEGGDWRFVVTVLVESRLTFVDANRDFSVRDAPRSIRCRTSQKRLGRLARTTDWRDIEFAVCLTESYGCSRSRCAARSQ